MKKQGVIFIVAFLGGFACRDADEPCLTCPLPYVQTIFLDTVYTEPAEIGVRVTMADSLATSIVQLFRDTTEIFSKRVLATDTTIVDDSLLPARTYRYIAYRLTNGQRVDSSNILTVRTMDTTSHEFRWEIDTLGDGNSSVLYDVAIVNDTLAYAVGEIYKRDSTGQFETDYYGIAKWNGREWKLSKILSQPGPFGYRSLLGPKGIFAFSEKDVWLADGGVHRYDGVSITHSYWINGFPGNPNPVLGDGQHIQKIWGTSSNNLYAVGTKGAIAHFDGTTWRRLESGTDVSLLDVWGSPDGSTVWACGWKDLKPTVFLRLQNNFGRKIWEEDNPITLREDSLSGILTSVWTPNNRKLFVASHNGVYSTYGNTQGEARRLPLPRTWPGVLVRRLRGNAINDWTIVGTYYSIAHFNGYTWRHYEHLMSGDGRLYSTDQKGNLIIAVGETYNPIHSKGIIFRGTR